ncbi:MAG TPA: ATP-binding protein, partial [Candidatus Coatesbacteria bacterium]|nr:ATP-binding protein [Candidatus Coatesbacteria bacterium]
MKPRWAQIQAPAGQGFFSYERLPPSDGKTCPVEKKGSLHGLLANRLLLQARLVEAEGEGGAPARGGGHQDLGAVQPGHLGHEGEPQPGAAHVARRLGPVELLEDVLPLLELEGAVEVSVSDEGPGIEPQEREHIFEKFYRAKSARDVGGTGL